MIMMSRLSKVGVAAMALSIGLAGVAAGSPALAETPPPLKAQCHLGGDMFVSAAPKGTHHVDYWSGYTVTSSKGPRFAYPTYSWLEPGDWVYAFAMASDGTTVLAQNLHVVCKD